MLVRFVITLLIIIQGIYGESLETKLKKRQPNWRPVTLSSYPNGSSEKVLFYAPDLDSDRDIPVKEIIYYPSGLARYEADLIPKNSSILPHGAAVWYYESGKIHQIAFFQEGVLQGSSRLFFNSGKVQEIIPFDQGMVNGRREIYDEKGHLVRVQNYLEGLPEGEWIDYYPTGQIARKTFYKEGVPHGKSIAWDEKGNETEKKEFFYGLRRIPPSAVVEIALLPDEEEEILEGVVKTAYPDGKPKTEESYSRGKLEGLRQAWYPSGKKAFEGAYQQGFPLGIHRTFSESGELLIEAHYAKGELEGPLREWYENGKPKIAAQYVQGKLDGTYQAWYPDGQIFQEQTWSLGRGVGEHREYYSEEKGKHALYKQLRYDQKGELDGDQLSFYPNGHKQSIMQYRHGVLHGLKAFYSSEGVPISEAHYHAGGLEGDYYELTYNGTEIKAHYVNNRLDGPYTIYYPQKEGRQFKAYEAFYRKGKLEGEAIEYSETGEPLSSSFFVSGKRNGLFTLFDKEGKVFITAEFVSDNQHGLTTEYKPSGEVHRTAHFVNDQKEGEELTYHDNGKLASRSLYRQGLLDGLSQEWNKEGILVFEVEYKAGKKNGMLKKYHDNGKPHIIQQFVDDVVVSKKEL